MPYEMTATPLSPICTHILHLHQQLAVSFRPLFAFTRLAFIGTEVLVYKAFLQSWFLGVERNWTGPEAFNA